MPTVSSALVRATARKAFWQEYDARPNFFDPHTFRVMSDSDQENYPFLMSAPSPRDMGNAERVKRTVPAIDYTIKNIMWESTVELGYPLIKHGRLDQVSATMAEQGSKARDHKNSLLSTLLNAGHTSTCYDGQFFFDTAHVDPGGSYSTSQDNDLTSAIVSSVAPTDLEWALAIRAMRAAFYTFKDAFGDPVIPGPDDKFIVMVPPGWYHTMSMRVQVADSLTGPIGNDLQGTYETVVNPWLSAPATAATFYMIRTGGVHKPFIHQTAEDVGLTMDDNYETKGINSMAFWYGNVGYGDWRYAVKYVFT